MVESLLSPGSFDIVNANRILNLIAVGSSSLARQEQIIRSGQQTKIEVVNQRTNKPRKSNEELTKIISFLSNVVDRIKTIRRLADSLTAEVSKADRFGAGDNAVQFDITLARLAGVAEQTSDEPNLLNSSGNTDFAFLTTKDGRVVTLYRGRARHRVHHHGNRDCARHRFNHHGKKPNLYLFRPRSPRPQAGGPVEGTLHGPPARKFCSHFQGCPSRQHRQV